MTVAALLPLALPAPHSIAATAAGLAEAIRAQRSRLEEAPRDVAALNDLANLLVLVGNLEEAEEAYRRALEIDPERVTTIYNLALLHAESGRDKLARRGFKQALKIDPDHAWSHYQLGTLTAKAGNRNQAIEHYVRAFRLEPRLTLPEFNPHILDNGLVIEALLLANAAEAAVAKLPKIYQDPERVRALLLPPPVAPPADAPVSRQSTTRGGGGIRQIGGSPGEIGPSPGETGGSPGGQVRETEAPSPPSAAEATRAEPQTAPGVSRADVPGQGVAASPQVPSGRAVRQPISGAAARPPGPAEPAPATRTPPPAEIPEAAPGPVGFEPDLGSTGRLELRLVPKAQDRLAALAAAPR